MAQSTYVPAAGRSGSTEGSGELGSEEPSDDASSNGSNNGAIVEQDLEIEGVAGEDEDGQEETAEHDDDEEAEGADDEASPTDRGEEAEFDEVEEQELLNRLKALESEEKELDMIHNQLKATVDKSRDSVSPPEQGDSNDGQDQADSDDLASARLTARAEDKQESSGKPPVTVSLNLSLGAVKPLAEEDNC